MPPGTGSSAASGSAHLERSYRPSAVIAGLPEGERADARKACEALDRLGGPEARGSANDPVRADIWVDDDGVTRRMRATSKLPAQAGTPAGSFAISYLLRDFGARLDTSGPPASERYDATQSVEETVKELFGR